MIQEIVNFMKYLRESSPKIFEEGLEPSKGLHILVELDENGNAKKFPGEKGKDWDYYDGGDLSEFLENIVQFEQQTLRIGTRMNKVFDKKKQIFSCSPFAISFKKQSLLNPKLKGKGFEKITNLLDFYFSKGIVESLDSKEARLKKLVEMFKNFLKQDLRNVSEIEEFNNMKKDFFINIYLKLPLDKYTKVHDNYLKRNLFNKNDYNTDKEITDKTYGLSGFFNGLNSKKPFLQHKTATMYRGIPVRIKAEDTIYLNDFDILLRRKIFPNPLLIFIDEREFETSDQIIKMFRQNTKLPYGEIIKKLFDENENLLLENYYLLFFGYENKKIVLKDFDFVSRFRYHLKDLEGRYPRVKNLFGIKKKDTNELISDREIKNIFQFEWGIVRTIFNNSLVRIDKNNIYSVKYFEDIDPKYVSGGDLVYLLILKYRKAFYDYIYKSKEEAINCQMWDEILWNSILADIKHDRNFDKGYVIKEKLNIWFSFYNYFANNIGRISMSSKIPELLEKMREIVNDSAEEKHFNSVDEFMFGAGQLIYYLLQQSRAAERSHALLEPFIQKVKADQLQDSIARLINTYKHELSFGQGRFERLAAEVLAFDTKENLKKYQRFLLAGYFSTPVIFEKKENGGGENE